MLKYIFLLILLIAFAFNFKAKAVVKFILKKEITEKQETVIRCVNYGIALICVILIIVFS